MSAPLALRDVRSVDWQQHATNERAARLARLSPCRVCGHGVDARADEPNWFVHLLAGGYLADVDATVRDDDDLGWHPVHDACAERVPARYRSHWLAVEDDPDAEALIGDDDDEGEP